MSSELYTLHTESEYLDDVLTTLRDRYAPESLVMGMFLGALIMEQGNRLLPTGATCAITHPEKRVERIDPYQVLGISDEQAKTQSEELCTIHTESKYLDDVLTTLRDRYAPESLVMGMFLGALILKSEGRLLPLGATCTIVNPALN